MLSACVAGCQRKDNPYCYTCGRTPQEREEWKLTPHAQRPMLFFEIAETSRERLGEERFSKWTNLYSDKLKKKMGNE